MGGDTLIRVLDERYYSDYTREIGYLLQESRVFWNKRLDSLINTCILFGPTGRLYGEQDKNRKIWPR